MTYAYRCQNCGQGFDRSGIPVDERDSLQPCEYCGNGADRVFTTAVAVQTPEGFRWSRSTFELTRDQAVARERENEAYLASKPPSAPSFEECMKKELDAVGYRHPHRLVDPSVRVNP